MPNTHGFRLDRQARIAEYDTNARWLRHERTGAQLLSLENGDENKVFGITLRTPPANSTGIAHIMEHSVLCGSQNYPIKKPFVELVKGSLNTFLNAFTYPDKTCYPVASQNLQDFYNLVAVYLDAVFFPLIPPHILKQEGWHFELEEPDAPLRYKGVVFNEMKGAYSSPDGLLGRKSMQLLFPGHTYGFDSGGDPQVIPDLTYDQFKAFHQKYYHPSNARFYFYGDDDPVERLRILDRILEGFAPQAPSPQIPLHSPNGTPERVEVPYAADDSKDGNSHMLAVNWVLPEVGDSELTLGLQILSHILVETPASPLRKALIESGLGEDLTGGGLNTYTRQMYFSTGMKGVAPENVDRVVTLIDDTLADLASARIDPQMVDSALNTVEFRLRENNTGSFPRGLALMLRALNSWLHDRDPIEALSFEAPLSAIKERLLSGEHYFENLLRDCLLENGRRTTVVMVPDPDLGARKEKLEAQRLAEVKAALNQQEIEALIQETRRLSEIQSAPDDPDALAAIPTLARADLDPQLQPIPLEVVRPADGMILYHDLFTNGILYLDVGFDLRYLPADLLPWVKLLGRALVEMGTESTDYVRLSQRIGQDTGGIRPMTFVSAAEEVGEGDFQAWLMLRTKAMVGKTGSLLSLLNEIIGTVKLDDRARFRQIVREEKARLEASLVPAGHQVVNTRLRANFHTADWVSEQIGGLSYLFAVREIALQIDRDWPGVLARLAAARQALLTRTGALANITVDAESWQKTGPEVADFLSRLPGSKPPIQMWQADRSASSEGLSIPAQVNYVGKGGDLYKSGYQLHGSFMAVIKYLRTTWLWEKIRVKGGAYGGLCQFDRHSGVFSYLSYRDPNLLASLEVYDQTPHFLRKADLPELEVTRSIIGAIGDLDAYQLPDAKGFASMFRYLIGDSDDHRQGLRSELLGTTRGDFLRFADALEALKERSLVTVLGSQASLQAALEEHPGLFKLKKVL
jgi:Zn-dependent M16 (insulinase) family peptidase